MSHFQFMEKSKVLLIDNSINFRNLFRLFAINAGFIPSTASVGLEGIALLRKFTMDCIICEYALPDLTAIELKHALRCAQVLSRNAKAPFVVVSDRKLSPRELKNLHNCGVADFRSKTEFLPELCSMVERLCPKPHELSQGYLDDKTPSLNINILNPALI